MPSDATIRTWVAALKEGDHDGARGLWDLYYPRLVLLAGRMLRGRRLHAADEEDVALSAFDGFCRGVERSRFPRLDRPENIWHLLTAITAREVVNLIEREGARKRNHGDAEADLDQVSGHEPTPASAAEMSEECDRLLNSLGDAILRRVAVLKMEGYSNDEIGGRVGISGRSVTRRLQEIRGLWSSRCPGYAHPLLASRSRLPSARWPASHNLALVVARTPA